MNNRERVNAILHYKEYDRLPLVHFGYWKETVDKWCDEGHLPKELKGIYDYDLETENIIADKIGFDFGWNAVYGVDSDISPLFETKTLEETADGFIKVLNSRGVIILQKEGTGSIPAEVDHTLKDRESWVEHFIPRLKFNEDRVNQQRLGEIKNRKDDGNPRGLFLGSLYGRLRDWLGIVGISYLYADDEELYYEMIDTLGNLTYRCTEAALNTGLEFDYAHLWEDICFKNGPLVSPAIFDKAVGPHYKRITQLLNNHGIDIISLDCDGCIDSLIPTWMNNGVNTMFPIEVGTWNASIAPWREKYGKEIRGVGGMDKKVFAYDYRAIDLEVERLKPLVDLGGYIPCPDHRIPPDAKWENVQYYCDVMRKEFS